MNLSKVRASIIASVTEARTTDDFPVPNGLVDHLIFIYSSEAIREQEASQRAKFFIEPSMVTRFDCLAVKLEKPKCLAKRCNPRFYVDLPAEPMDLEDDGGLVSLHLESPMLWVTPIHPSKVGDIEYLDRKPSYQKPAFIRVGRRVYLVGGDRDFTVCPVVIQMVVGGVDRSGIDPATCKTGVSVPVTQKLVGLVEQKCVRRLLAMLEGNELDLVADGNQQEDQR